MLKRSDILSYSTSKNDRDRLEFQALAWHAADEEVNEDDDDDDQQGQQGQEFVIRVFGVTSEGSSVSLAIRSFTPHFYIKVDGRWTPGQTKSLKEFILFHKKLDVIQVKSVSKKDFYGFRNGQHDSFVRVDFKTLRGMKIMAAKLRKPVDGRGISFNAGEIKLYENNIEPVIRFMHMRDVQPAGWLSVARQRLLKTTESRCDHGYSTRWTFVDAMRHKHESAPFIVASFDLECSSSHGDFPTAKKDWAKLAMEIGPAFKAAFAIPPNEYDGRRFVERCIKTSLGLLEGEGVAGISRTHLKSPCTTLPHKFALLVDDIHAYVSKKVPSIDPLAVMNGGLPPVKGDEIIQIGVTMGIYGRELEVSNKLRHIFVLGGCSEVSDATVYVCKTERELLTSFAAFVCSADPDVLVGYNILGFDMEYIYIRASELSCRDEVLKATSRLRFCASTYTENKLSSSALGDNLLKIIDMPGRVIMDVMKVVQRDHKLDSFKLDSVAEHFIGNKKNDVSPADIFRLQKGSDEDRAIIAAYCVQDCELVLRIAWKLEIIANNIGMANVCSVPLMYIFMRGQGVKIFSLVAKQCKLDNFLVPTMRCEEGDGDEEGYEGAIVLEPQSGIYMEPVSVLDYASLYPSSMISENLSHDTIVLDGKFADVPGVEYIDISYDIHEGIGPAKVKVGERVCRFAQTKQQGVIPRILQDLIRQRKATRKMIEHKSATLTDGRVIVGQLSNTTIVDASDGREYDVGHVRDAYNEFQKAVLDGLQTAYKVTANSLYGALGARTNPLYLKDLAACTTATGRALILKAKAFVQTEFGARVIYGDSVAGYTPVLVRFDGVDVMYATIESLATSRGYNRWSLCEDAGREEKEACELHRVESWTDLGWSPVRRIIRHALAKEKRMVQIATSAGMVHVTDDHSLLGKNGETVSPKSLRIGDPLMHAVFPSWTTSAAIPSLSVDVARIMGMFAGCDSSPLLNGEFIWSCARRVVDWYFEMCSNAYPHVTWTITGPDADGVFVLGPEGPHASSLLATFTRSLAVPVAVLASPSAAVRRAFFEGFETSNPSCVVSSHLTGATLYYLAHSIGLVASITITNTRYAIKTLDLWNDSMWNDSVTDISYLADFGERVYDLTTDNHHFAAGVGHMIVHNTDSIFCIFNNRGPNGDLLEGKDALRNSIEIGVKASNAFKPHLKPPHDLEYEKTFFPFIILSKKRYVGNLYEHDVDKFKQKSMGIVLKRRDNANIVKKIYGGIIDIILNRQDVPESVRFLKQSLDDLVHGRTSIQDLVITKSLRASYKDPDRIAHQVLAKRMGDRDPGNRPQASDRIPFVYIVQPKALLQGERIEHPAYVQEMSLKIDFRFYIEHQIMKPVIQLYAIVLEQLVGYAKPAGFWAAEAKKWRRDLEGNIAKANDKIAVLREREAQRLLFDPVVQEIDLKTKGLRKITDFFSHRIE